MDSLEYSPDDETSRRQPPLRIESQRRSYNFPIELAEGRPERDSFLRPGIERLSDDPLREYGDPQSNPRIQRLISRNPVPVAEPRPSSSLRLESAEFPNYDDEYSRSVLTSDRRRLSPRGRRYLHLIPAPVAEPRPPSSLRLESAKFPNYDDEYSRSVLTSDRRRLSTRGRRILPQIPVPVAEPGPSSSYRSEPTVFPNDDDEHTCAVVTPDGRCLDRATFVKKNPIIGSIQAITSGEESSTPPKPPFRTPPFGSLNCHICKYGREGALIYLCQYRCGNRQVVHVRCLQNAIHTGFMTRCSICCNILEPQVSPQPARLPMQQGEHRIEVQELPEDAQDSLRSRIFSYLQISCVRRTFIVTSALTGIALLILGIYLLSQNKEH